MAANAKPNLVNDGKLTIAVGASRHEKTWKHRTLPWSQLVGKLATTTRTRETQAEYYSRAREDKRRGDAFNTCNYPPKPAEELRELQPTLIDVPEPDPVPHWRW